MKVCLLASGSKGNALLVCTGRSRVLVDAGLSARELCRRLAMAGVAPEDLDAVLVTHEHIDHVRGLGPLSRRYGVPVYLHHEAAAALADNQRLARVVEFAAGPELVIGDLAIRAFPVTHDAQAPVGFSFDDGAGRTGVATDLGVATRLVAEELRNCRTLVLESNHDEDMLRDGPYPWPLKQRIRSSHGHLSNRDSAGLLETLCWEGLENVLLAHLSETNNHPELARRAAEQTLAGQDLCRPQLLVGSQDRPTAWAG
ncbi:MAG: MBL fold metallo-hydrolase [Deltaproteobacteria bacterium]|nr:MAG: MBL fold metallo-hydrolase [Deltaproteobacteria bacterium]